MKHAFIIIFGLSVFGLTTPLFAQQDYWSAVRKDYQHRQDIPEYVREQIMAYETRSDNDSREMAQYLTFLYAYMPQSDLFDYYFNFFEQQVALAREARNTFSWGKDVPEELFRHFVVVYRVNNENLDTARAYIFHQLKNRIQNMSMYEAALEVNHWCHEYVDYQPADVRTSAPLATLKTSHGRCGEESTLTVTALRAVGIPARQCYTPRWAHCDDNHAWVEAYVDGKWHFLGACEPDPELDMGWFAVPSSRTMMVHTNVFGKYLGPEEVNKQTRYYSCINVLSNYADTVRLTVTVTDENNRPIPDATVLFKLYNYAEYYTLASRKTDLQGQASLITGKGDLLIWVKKEGRYAYAKADCRTQHHLTLTLGSQGAQEIPETILLDMNPPKGGATLTTTTPDRQALNERRKQYEDSLREAYRATFPTADMVKATLQSEYFSDEELYDIVRRSEGNYNDVMNFLQKHRVKEEGIYLREYIYSLADKDLRDTPEGILENNLHKDLGKFPKEVFVKGLLAPRISNEMLRYPNAILWKVSHKELGEKPTLEQIRQYTVENIVVDDECNYFNCPISPEGVAIGKRADWHSLGIFFVALCRERDVPAYMDNASGEIYAWENGAWQNVKLYPDADIHEKVLPYGTIVLHNPQHYTYYPQYTLQRLVDGEFVSYDYENDPRVDKSHIVLSVPAGRYCLSTGNRYSNGDVLSRMEFFTVSADETVEKQIILRPLTMREHNYGSLDMDQTFVNGISLQTILAQSGKDKLILCLVTPGTEPVNHLVKELETKRKAYETWGGSLFFVADNGNWKPNKHLPANLTVTQKGFAPLREQVLNGLVETRQGDNPVCIVVNRQGTILFFSEGYHIGLGDLLLEEVK